MPERGLNQPRAGTSIPAEAAAPEVREWDRTFLASGRHFPQQAPTPSVRFRSRMQLAPSFTAERICRSETALQTQTIMAVL
jgi:anti-sigma-K factor RskA